MKNNNYKMIFCLGLSILFFSLKANSQTSEKIEVDDSVNIDPNNIQSIQQQLTGTYLLENNQKSKLVFTTNKVYEYYNGVLIKSFFYSISETSPQCGEEVPTGPKFIYIKWTNETDQNDTYCYEINTLNNQYLSLVYIGSPNFQPTVYQKVQY